MMSVNVASFLYLVSGILFILALRGLSHPTTSRQGNFYGMIGMAICDQVEGDCLMEALQKALDQLDQASAAVRLALQDAANHPGVADAAGGAAHALSGGAIDPFVFRFAIFVLAIFVGYYVVWSVTPALHTPLMAVTNAISSVIVVGALLAVGVSAAGAATGFGFIALVLVSVNIFGGFLVTQRMLAMYKKKDSAGR